MNKESYNIAIPSGRIARALDNLERFENQPGCVVRMNSFGGYDPDEGLCFACLAGADGIIESFNISRMLGLAQLSGYELSVTAARQGNIGEMFHLMSMPSEDGFIFNRQIPCYHECRDGFYSGMRELVDDLTQAGY